jgi:integrase
MKVRKKPYFVSLGNGLSLGYRRNKNGNGTWVFRRSNGKGGMETKAIGAADDYRDADDNEILTYVQAQTRVLAMGNPNRKPAPGTMTVEQAFYGYLPSLRGRNQRSANLTEGRVKKHVFPTLGSKKVVDLTTTELDTWLSSVVKKSPDKEVVRKSQDSANRVLSMVKAFLNHAQRDVSNGIPSDDAWRKVKAFHGVAKAREVRYSPEEAKLLISNAETTEFEDLLTGAYLTGGRYEELTDARVKHFDKRGKQLYVYGKTKGRDIILQPDACTHYIALTSGKDPEDYIYLREDGCKWNTSDQVRRINAAIEKSKLDERGSFYSLRHAYISESIERNVPLTVIAQNCGTSVRMIERNYAKVLKEKKREFIEQGAPTLH